MTSQPSGSTSRTNELLARDGERVWHPFTQHARWATDEPLVIDRAEGMYLYDADGRAYLDANSSLWVNVHGHKVPEIDAAIVAQLQRRVSRALRAAAQLARRVFRHRARRRYA